MLRPCGNYKKSYPEDAAIFQTRFTKVCMALFFLMLILLPFLLRPYQLHFINMLGIFVLGALGMNILTGFTGVISIGQGVFVGLGAYATAILMIKFKMHFLLAFPLGAVVTAFLSLIPGVSCLRIKGIYLLMPTLAAHVAFNFVIIETASLTGGDMGLSLPKSFVTSVEGFHKYYFFLIFSLVVVLTLFARNLLRTKIGRIFIAIRDNDLAAEVLGISVGKYRLVAFWLSSFYAGLAGGLWAGYVGVVSVEQFGIDLSIMFLAIILIGGMGSVMGSILGTVFMLMIPEILSVLAIATKGMLGTGMSHSFQIINNGIFGLLIIVFLIYEPLGLAKIWWKIRSYWKLWPFSYTGV
ncbi:MAG: branched-chain amino acid ABC transporter permease [Deltaproteobacteria bacterium]|nr:branched-chain amino acid ABC transporter permease [Deltaproteobacteria bacterium]MBW2342937.1 branched-chain amino acid ABC transporter permease [Deltaproteobacteria bacterium]